MEINEDEVIAYMMFQELVNLFIVGYMFFMIMYGSANRHYQKYMLKNRTFVRYETRVEHMNRLVRESDVACIDQLRMDRRAFAILCELLRTAGQLKVTGNFIIEEKVAMFLNILAHHTKNRVIKFQYRRSGETVSRYFNEVLNSVLRVQGLLLRAPEPVPEDCTEERWKWFKVHIYYSIRTYLATILNFNGY